MSLLGIDVGTTGCKASAFSADGRHIASAYREYDIHAPQSGYAELDARTVWGHVQTVIAEVAKQTSADPITAISVSSLGEAVVPVTADREILAPSILNFDRRGEEYIDSLAAAVPADVLYQITGNTLGNHFSLTKMMWVRDHQPQIYDKTFKLLPWGSFVPFMLGADPVLDYSLAGRTLLFNVDHKCWSDKVLAAGNIESAKLPATAPSGTVIGRVSDRLADHLALQRGVAVVAGAHDQCANAVGCGVYQPGTAMLGMGTYHCIVVVSDRRQDGRFMAGHGFNTEYHAAPDRFVTFIYNHGGSLVKWYRDTFAASEHRQAQATGHSIYPSLFTEMPSTPSQVIVLPHFAPTGPPEFVADSSGVMVGLKLETSRGEILRGICEGTIYYLRQAMQPLIDAGVPVEEFRAVGGGSKSDAWLQITADIVQRPIVRPAVTETGALGAAILAGLGTGVFSSLRQAASIMVKPDRTFTPAPNTAKQYDRLFEKYAQLWPLTKPYLISLHQAVSQLG